MGINELLANKDYYVAFVDELAIEAQLPRRPENSPDFVDKNREDAAMRAALLDIDRLKANGGYEAERERLRERLTIETNVGLDRLKNFKFDPKLMSHWGNLRAGMESPDPGQRIRFNKYYETTNLGPKTFREIIDFIAVLEPAQKKKGRPPDPEPPWRKDVWALDEMRLLCAQGVSIPKAARLMAKKEGKIHQDSRAKLFDRHYRQRMKLRDFN